MHYRLFFVWTPIICFLSCHFRPDAILRFTLVMIVIGSFLVPDSWIPHIHQSCPWWLEAIQTLWNAPGLAHTTYMPIWFCHFVSCFFAFTNKSVTMVHLDWCPSVPYWQYLINAVACSFHCQLHSNGFQTLPEKVAAGAGCLLFTDFSNGHLVTAVKITDFYNMSVNLLMIGISALRD